MDKIEALLSQISVNTHSSICITAEGKTIWIDPFELPEEPEKADVIFLTHDHFDHYSPKDVEKLLKPDTAFVLPESTAKLAAAQIGSRHAVVAAPGEAGEIGGICFEAVAAYNPNKRFHPKENGWVGYVLTVDGLRVYIAGDTDATVDAAAVRCDVALLPIGGTYTMDAKEAAALAKQLRPKAVVPVHYGSVAGSPGDFDRFAKAIGKDVPVCRKI